MMRALSYSSDGSRKYLNENSEILENFWQLPEDKDGNIRSDVVEYLENFDKYLNLTNKEQHWLSIEDIFSEITGISTDA